MEAFTGHENRGNGLIMHGFRVSRAGAVPGLLRVNVYDGREVRFCCSGCVKRFEADKAGYLAKIDAKARSTKP
ncbi:MAG: hypothetical protein AAB363_08640, partial [Planctomycetota bacterium]